LEVYIQPPSTSWAFHVAYLVLNYVVQTWLVEPHTERLKGLKLKCVRKKRARRMRRLRREDKKWEVRSENPNRPKKQTVYRARPNPDE
jgi:hypothetical protein